MCIVVNYWVGCPVTRLLPMKNNFDKKTKTCPECMEAVDLLAIRCCHCGTTFKDIPSLVRRGLSESTGKIIYVLDRDLVRFIKVTASVLTLFIIVGLYLFGIDLKNTQKEMADGRDYIEKSRVQIEKDRIIIEELIKNLDKFKKQIIVYREASRMNARQAEESLDTILLTQNKVKIIHTELSRLKDGEFQVRTKTIISDNTPTVSSERGKLWPVGARITITLLEGSTEEREKVKKWALQWVKYANVEFEFVDSSEADIRIGFRKGEGSWSYVGVDSLNIVKKGERTMNLGWLTEANVLHQFGHVLGLIHEHQLPGNPIPWDEEKVYKYFTGAPNNWTREVVFQNILKENAFDIYPIPKVFDKKSIMMYDFSFELMRENYSLEAGKILSEGDKQFISKIYPRNPESTESTESTENRGSGISVPLSKKK